MEADPALSEAILEHLADLDAACAYLEGPLNEALLAEAGQAVSRAVSKLDWYQANELWDNLWIAPHPWLDDTGEDAPLWFAFDFVVPAQGSGDRFALTSITGSGRGGYGLFFYQQIVRDRAWFTQASAQPELVRQLQAAGFVLTEGRTPYFYVPVRVDRALLSSSLEKGDFSEAMRPFEDAIMIAANTAPVFEQFTRKDEAATGRG
jgi:hypothetical protein